MFRRTWHRAKVSPGRCVVCGCTDAQPCAFHRDRPLWWVDTAHLVCAAPRCFKFWRRLFRVRRLQR